MDVSVESNACFNFLSALPLAEKPRRRGITIANDRRLSHEHTRSLIEVAGDVLDFVKMPDHYGLILRFSEAWLREKIALYHDADILTTVGGSLYEVAAVQNKVEPFMQRAADLGFAGVEVSEDIIDPQPRATRAAHIKLGRSLGLHVFTEIGRKFPDGPFDPDDAVELAQSDLDAGSAMVVVENSDIIRILEEKSDSLHRFVERMPADKLIFEVGPHERMRVTRWLLEEFGPEVNLENIEIEDASATAAMRAGLHRNVGFSYFDGLKASQ